MRKQYSGVKLSRTSNERRQLFRNLMASVVNHGYIVTSEAKAKAVKPQLEKLVTTAKANSLVSFRKLLKETGNSGVTKKLIELGGLFAKRPGGYMRIIRLHNQKGDNTQVVRLEWVDKLVKPEIISAKKEITKKEVEAAIPVENVKEEKPKKITKAKTKPKTKVAKSKKA